MTIDEIQALIAEKPFHAHTILKKQHPSVWDAIVAQTFDGIQDKTASETLYRYINAVPRSMCHCGKVCPFLSLNKGYQNHCSNRCAQLDPAIVSKREHTCMEKYGVPKTIIRNMPITRETRIARYGVPHYTSASEFSNKVAQTNMRVRGVRHHMQDDLAFKTSQKAQLRLKHHVTTDGGHFDCQGYEPHMLDLLVSHGISSTDITTSIKSIHYEWDNKHRRYFPDIYVRSLNLMVEVKSEYYFNRDYKQNMVKHHATKAAGFDHIIVVFAKDGTLLHIVGNFTLVGDPRVDKTKANHKSTS